MRRSRQAWRALAVVAILTGALRADTEAAATAMGADRSQPLTPSPTAFVGTTV